MAIDRDSTLRFIELFASAVEAHREELTQLDTAIGDGDHGTNLHRGMQAALAKLREQQPADIAAVLKTVATTLISTVGGASGPLYGTLFLRLSSALAGAAEVDAAAWAAAWRTALDGVQALGKAAPGDKTMVDALSPAVDALAKAGDLQGLGAAADAARAGMLATVPLVARKGRASYLGERSAGHQDPGATSACYLLEAAAEAFGEEREAATGAR